MTKREVLSALEQALGVEAAKKFFDDHQISPEAYYHFRTLCQAVIAQGRTRYGASAIANEMRWWIKQDYNRRLYKVNNDNIKGWATLFELEFPQHDLFKHRSTARYTSMSKIQNFMTDRASAMDLHEIIRLAEEALATR